MTKFRMVMKMLCCFDDMLDSNYKMMNPLLQEVGMRELMCTICHNVTLNYFH